MPRTKTGEFNQIAYQNEFNKRNYDRIEIKVPKGRKAVIKAAATAAESGIEFLKRYCELEPSFEAVLKDEFSIEI